ncbi:hypothetical protein [Parolsenella catena]|uniref:hypothetical protein n=1 Tax=Parolsenella catena TaxID=2003188 RepID=UPI002E7973C9|nr:hypothetical protein [Parolsenella catena]
MTSRRANPAIYAGLAGACAWGVPTCAQALTVMGHEVPTSDPAFTFAAGCVVGAVVAGGVSAVVSHAVASRAARDEVASAMAAVHEPVRRTAGASAPAADETAARSAQSRPSAMREWEQTGNIRVQSVSDSEQAEAAIEDAWSAWEAGAKASSDYVDVAEGYVRTRTFAERMSARAKGVASVLSERLGAAKMDGLPVIARADGSVGDVGESWWDEAFGADVRTVASASFGGQSVEDTMAGNSAVLFTAQTPAEAAAARAVWQSQQAGAHQPAAEPQAPTASQGTPTPRPAAPASNAPTVRQQAQVRPCSVRDELDARLGNPEEAFPEKKRYTDEQQDLWAVALAALDERYEEQVNMAAPAPAPAPMPAGAEMLDEPEGLAADTAFIPFRPQAGHPEVVDTDSYVDLLVDQELARNESASVRRLARHKIRDYFKVIDGTGDITGARHLAASQA